MSRHSGSGGDLRHRRSPSDPVPDLTVVTPTHRQPHCLEPVLDSLAQQRLPRDRFEVIVVEDPSEVSYRSVAEQARALGFRFEALASHAGRSAARNRALALARGELVLFLDSDCYAAPDLLERHWRFHTQRSEPGVLLGTRLETSLPVAGRLIRGGQLSPQERSRHCFDLRFQGQMTSERAQYAMRTPWLYTYNNISLRRELVTSVGGFDEAFGTRWGCEDIDLFYRVYLHLGRPEDRFVYDQAAIAYHLPHYRDARQVYADAGANDLVLKRKHPHFEIELGVDNPHLTGYKVQLYRHGVAWFTQTGANRVGDQVAGWLKRALAEAPARRLLYAGSGSAELPLPEGTVTLDPGAPPDPSNHHLLGIATTYPDREFDLAVNVDLWRILQWDDLCRLVTEGLRIADRLVLAHTGRLDPPPAGSYVEVVDDVEYLARALRPHVPVTVDRVADELILLRLGSAAG